MPCDLRIRVRAYDLSKLESVCSSLGLAATRNGDYIHINGKGVNKIYRQNDLLEMSQSEIASALGKAVQDYATKKTLEALRKQGLRFSQKQVEGRVEITVEN